MVDGNHCPWCEVKAEFPQLPLCTSTEGCDFASLPLQPSAIIERMKSERARIDEIQKRVSKMRYTKVEDAHEDVALLKDLVVGLQVMAHALNKKFGWSQEDIKKETGFGTRSLAERIRSKTVLAKFKLMRKMGGMLDGSQAGKKVR